MQPRLELLYTVYTMGQLKELEQLASLPPQIALAGRSNVGKSSLVNALAGRKNLARTSASPGKTRSLNFFHVLPQNYCLADLPGYGYARCSKAEREKWAKLINAYLSSMPKLCAVALLIDSRLPPQDPDRDLAAFVFANRLTLIPVLTKIDKCSLRERAQREKEWKSILGLQAAASDQIPILGVSAKTSVGLEKLWAIMHQIAQVDNN